MGISTLLTVVTLFTVQCLAPGAEERAAMKQLRSGDSVAAALLQRGLHDSPTFRDLVAHIEDSDLVVYVIADRFLREAGKTQIVHSTPRWRYVRVTVRAPGLEAERDVVGWLAHELQHVVEVADAPHIRDDATLEWYYQHHGWDVGPWGQTAYETDAADDVKWAVLDELYGGESKAS